MDLFVAICVFVLVTVVNITSVFCQTEVRTIYSNIIERYVLYIVTFIVTIGSIIIIGCVIIYIIYMFYINYSNNRSTYPLSM